jgi:hypothetical protein
MSLQSPKFAKFGFLTLTPGNAITILGAQGIKALSIYVTSDSTGNCTLTGSIATIGGVAATGLTIIPGDPAFNVGSGVENMDIDGITISAAAGCTVKISALNHQILP